ncbi:MAG: SCO family protein [Xanthobacteraceae bacterium]
MNRAGIALALLACVMAAPARAVLTQRDLASVALAPPPGARVPLSLAVHDLDGRSASLGEALAGRPALFIPVDVTCRTVCGPALSIAAAALAQTGLRPAADYRLIVWSFDAKDSADAARSMIAARMPEGPVARAARVLQGDDAAASSLMTAIGYRAVYDTASDQYAHPAGMLTLAGDGRVTRVLSSLALNAHDLRLALVEAGDGRVGTLGDRITLLCSQFDPARGIYSSAVSRVLMAAGALTVALIAGALVALLRRERLRRKGAA